MGKCHNKRLASSSPPKQCKLVTRLQICDTEGHYRLKAVAQVTARSYYRGAASSIIVYGIANRSSFDHVATWLVEAVACNVAPATVIFDIVEYSIME
jgi:GTPase SAR1 family protein